MLVLINHHIYHYMIIIQILLQKISQVWKAFFLKMGRNKKSQLSRQPSQTRSSSRQLSRTRSPSLSRSLSPELRGRSYYRRSTNQNQLRNQEGNRYLKVKIFFCLLWIVDCSNFFFFSWCMFFFFVLLRGHHHYHHH